jgi:hypothetical protein
VSRVSRFGSPTAAPRLGAGVEVARWRANSKWSGPRGTRCRARKSTSGRARASAVGVSGRPGINRPRMLGWGSFCRITADPKVRSSREGPHSTASCSIHPEPVGGADHRAARSALIPAGFSDEEIASFDAAAASDCQPSARISAEEPLQVRTLSGLNWLVREVPSS